MINGKHKICNIYGYTLIELMVVIAIIAILSLVGFVNFKSFSVNQIPVKAAGQVQSYLRLAQSNATTSTLCNGLTANNWFLTFSIPKPVTVSVELGCSNSVTGNYQQSIYTLDNVTLGFYCSNSRVTNFLSSSSSITYAYAIGFG